MTIEQLGKAMTLAHDYTEFDFAEIIEVLKEADDQYYNHDGDSFLTDAEYDGLRSFARQLQPHNVYFTGVGSNVRGGKIKLPYEMGSLDQVEIGEIVEWVGDWSLQNHFMVVTDKLDGTSAMIVYDDNGDLQIAYSRGNGVEGADITRHIKHIVPANIGHPAVIRGEVIIPTYNFEDIRKVTKSRSGRQYKNARNMVAGLMNAKENDEKVYPFMHFVAYDIVNFEGTDKVGMLCDLQKYGFKTPFWSSFYGRELTDGILTRLIDKRRDESSYEIDGVVIEVNSSFKREQMNPTRDTLNPAYAVKYKVADASNLATAKVVGVHWRPSKHGYLKPRVEIEPIDLVGVTVRFATGFNAKFIWENKIGPFSLVEITRSGDVIPFIKRTIRSAHEPQMPNENWEWITNDDGVAVDIILIDHHEHDEVLINQMVDFFGGIEAPMLRKGNIKKLYEHGECTISDIIRLSEQQLVSIIGENGKKVYSGLKKALTNIPLWKLMGSTNFFGRGIGKRKMKKLLGELGHEVVFHGNVSDFVSVEGFDEKTAQKVVDGIPKYLDWVYELEDDGFIIIDYDVQTNKGGLLVGEKIVMTGFRDKELAANIESEGGENQSAISSKTTILIAKNPNSTSGKMKKARDLGVRIMGIEQFKEMLK